MKAYAIYSCDGDPSGSVHTEISLAEDRANAFISSMRAETMDKPHLNSISDRADLNSNGGKCISSRPNNFVTTKSDKINKRSKMFISYSHKDEKWLEELVKMLKPVMQKVDLDLWSDSRISPGAEWLKEIEVGLGDATAALLLVSANFLASDFIMNKELKPILDARDRRGLQLYWIYVSSCIWEFTSVEKFQAIHDTKLPLDRLLPAKRRAVMSEICKRIAGTLAPAKMG